MGLSALWVLHVSAGTRGWDKAQAAGTGGLNWWVQHGTKVGNTSCVFGISCQPSMPQFPQSHKVWWDAFEIWR